MRLKSETSYSSWIMYFVISLFLLGVDSLGWSSGVRSLGDKVLNPISFTIRNTTTNLLKPIQMIRFISSGPERILDLESRYAEAVVSLEELETVKKENASLKKLLGNDPSNGFIYQPVSVVGGSDEIILSAGSTSGIDAGDTVVDASNVLVGRVTRISTYTSWVTTPKYHLSNTPVIIGSQNVSGSMISRSDGVQVDIEQSDSVNLGDYVFTSGANGDYIPKILIGRVSFVEEESANIYKKVSVDFLSNLTDTAFIVKGTL